jgi:probable addiction module antidote protein
MRKFRTHEEYLIESLQDPLEAKAYLKVILEEYEKDNNSEIFLDSLRIVAQAQGGLSRLAKKTKLNRQNLYRALSKNGNPRIDTVSIILRELGFRFSIERIKNKKAH